MKATRENAASHKIAILATGDEVVNGDIMNSNTQEIAARLTTAGMHISTHLAVADNIREIETALHFLFTSHDAIITTGGLGPTSDDLTRFALSNFLQRPLQFNETTWEEICSRLKRFGYGTPPESNRQQALFPEDVTIIANPHGTAAGCFARKDQKIIFMLPGPPAECLPMVDHTVIPELKNAGFETISFHKKWLLLGASEGQIAEELDKIAEPFACITGYRLFYPYIEFKIHSNKKSDFEQLVPLIENKIQAFIIEDGQAPASFLLRSYLAQGNVNLHILDIATGGALQAALEVPMTRVHLNFSAQANSPPEALINIQGLREYWEQEMGSTRTALSIHMAHAKNEKNIDVEIPFRTGARAINYAVEFICAQIYHFLKMPQEADGNFNQN
jgi:nicotinamide-nucleotide amidase